ncbi:hypothetical protein [Nocardia sp. NPDC020380]|uniref:hypothetical protein n=1 Tax=Nocardia sp. NPDC020380 TaxID=3364309 RepID=UPI00379DDC3C
MRLRLGRYNAWAYWPTVVMVGVFGTPVVAVPGLLILALVTYLAVTESDVQQPLQESPRHQDPALRR